MICSKVPLSRNARGAFAADGIPDEAIPAMQDFNSGDRSVNTLKTYRLIGAIVFASFLASASAHAVKLDYHVKPGDQWKHRIVLTGSGAAEGLGQKMELVLDGNGVVTYKVNSVNTDGSFVAGVDYKTESRKVMLNGAPVLDDVPAPMNPLTVTLNTTGKAAKVEGLEGSAAAGDFDFGRIFLLLSEQYSENEVNTGDTWDASPDPALLKLTATGKLLSVDKQDGKDVARVEYTYTMTAENLSALLKEIMGLEVIGPGGKGLTGTLTATVDLTTGIPVSTIGAFDFDFSLKMNEMEFPAVIKLNVEKKPEV